MEIPSITSPVIRFIALLFFVKKPIMFLLHCPETKLKANSGAPSPNPNAIKLNMLEIKSPNKKALAKNAAIKAGLHGITIAPKKKPKTNALFNGFLLPVWMFALGINLEKLRSNIKARLIKPRMANATGEIMLMTLVRDFCRRVVNTNPSKTIKIIIPVKIVKPKRKKVLLLSFPENLFDKKAKNPGYNGKTQTAVKGVNKPKIKELAISKSKDILASPFYFFLQLVNIPRAKAAQFPVISIFANKHHWSARGVYYAVPKFIY